MHALRVLLLSLLVLPLASCTTVAYYGQAVHGHLAMVAATRPVGDVIDDPATASAVKVRLRQTQALLAFAADELGLPANGSYAGYADLQREAAVWSLVATPADSLQPHEWCYPVIGCASYRGYFDEHAAERHAAQLAAQGLDVVVEPVPAYSTLGWFDDPLPSTVIDWPLDAFAGLLFHELSHQRVYAVDDSAFNEAYATVVEREGVRRWLARVGTPSLRAAHALRMHRQQQFLDLLGAARTRLQALYAQPRRDDLLASGKAAVFTALRDDYEALRAAWGGYAGFDRWFDRPLNNAHLASVATYNELTPALRALLDREAGDMRRFHERCAELAGLPQAERDLRLRGLSAVASSVGASASRE
ncbi:MAG: aminopeptidase [Gammaproteobacteria bacterium]|nr:aminopeptidase [Gammaproteobacteria bacterium]